MRRRSLAAVASVVCAASGCAALSLFSDTHHHQHGSPDLDRRVVELERRAAALEAQLATLTGMPAGAAAPVLPAPPPQEVTW